MIQKTQVQILGNIPKPCNKDNGLQFKFIHFAVNKFNISIYTWIPLLQPMLNSWLSTWLFTIIGCLKTSKTWGIMPESGSNYQLLVGYALHGNQIRMNITKFWNGIFFWTWMMPDKITTTKMDRLSVEKNWITWWRRPAKFRFLFFSSRGSSSPAAGRIKKKSNLITLFLL